MVSDDPNTDLEPLFHNQLGSFAGMYTIEHLLMRDTESKGYLESAFHERQKGFFQYQSE